MNPDIVNALFEFGGALAILASVMKLARDKCVRGVHWFTTAFFGAWGLWNLYYYPSLDQFWSFAAGLAVVTANALYLAMICWYMEPRH